MRVKIVGPVTPERLAEALEAAAIKFCEVAGETFGGFFGANLYLQAYNSEGQQVDLHEGDKPVMLTLHLPDGASLRPAAPAPRLVAVSARRGRARVAVGGRHAGDVAAARCRSVGDVTSWQLAARACPCRRGID